MRLTHSSYSLIYSLLICLIGFLLVDGCTGLRNEVDPGPLGLASPKLVVIGFLSPQDQELAVKVTRSSTVVGDSLSLLQTGNNVTDATVTISEGSKSVVLRYNNVVKTASDTVKQPYYSTGASIFAILAGHTYTLTVTTPNGQRATSTCTIPQPVNPTQVTFDSLTDVQRRGQNVRYYVLTKWKDPVGKGNAYQVAGFFFYKNASCKACEAENYTALSFDDDNRGLIPDDGQDGAEMPATPSKAFIASSATHNFFTQYKTARVTVNLMSVDQAYYKFQSAVIQQRRSRNNPFAEPVLIPSNIDGGLGCFAGYNNATLTLKIK